MIRYWLLSILAVLCVSWLAAASNADDERAAAGRLAAQQHANREQAAKVRWADLDKVGQYMTAYGQIGKK